MTHRHRFALLIVSLSTVLSTLAAERFIVKDGEPQATIVIAKSPARMARLAASELQTYVTRITGATLPIETEPSATRVNIYVGRSPHTERMDLDLDDLRHGAYRMAAGADGLVLAGSDREFEPVEPYGHSRTGGSGGRAERQRIDREWDAITGETFSNPFHGVYIHWKEDLGIWDLDDAGTLNAVYDFLRAQGVRWYFPGELGEIMPRTRTIALPATDAVVRPDFALRKLGWWQRGRSMTADEDLWSLRLGMNDGADIIGLTQLCHGSKFVHLREEFKQLHPEYLALYGGQRALRHKGTQGAPCLSSEGFHDQHLRFVRAVFDHYDEPPVSIDVVDGYGRGLCQCPLCKGKDTPDRGWKGLMSDYVLGYVNRVASELFVSHPDKMVSALSYGSYKLPPETIEQFPPNLAVWICQTRKMHYDRRTREEALDVRASWLEKLPSKQLFIYDYYLASRPDGAWNGVPVYFPHRIAEDLRSLKGISLGEHIGLYQPPQRGPHPYQYLAIGHLNVYLTTRLWWNAEQDVDTLLDEYVSTFFGPAANEMRTFIDYGEANWPRMRKEVAAIDRAQELIAAARTAAGESIYGRRVQMIVEYMEPLHTLREELSRVREDVPLATAATGHREQLTLDGKLDDAFWSGAPVYDLQKIEAGGEPMVGTSFRMVWAKDALYVGIECREPDMPGLRIGTTEDDNPNVWSGDAVELLLETQFHSYYQIAISPSGAVTDLDRERGLNTSWNAGAAVATHQGPAAWSIEIRLPAAGENAKEIDSLFAIAGTKPTDSYPWFMNICRQRLRGDTATLSGWSPTGIHRFNVPMKFGKVIVK